MKRLEGLYVQFSNKLDPEANRRIHALCETLLKNLIPGITDIIPGYVNLYIEFDGATVSRSSVHSWVKKYLQNLGATSDAREVIVPTRYDGEDLAWVAEQKILSVDEVIARHSQRSYYVYMLGFAPGQPLMGTLDETLYLPRRSTPRKRVPANSVAIAVAQTCIYSLATPGGWHLLGTALKNIYDPHRDEPFLFAAGDRVRFVPSDEQSNNAEIKSLELLPSEVRLPVFRVEEPGLLEILIDEGRFFAARFGMARSGPMDARSARLANACVGNKANEALLELTLKGPVLSVLRNAVIAFSGFGMQCLIDDELMPSNISLSVKKGQRLSFKPSSSGARAYLAVAGGFETNTFKGSRSVDVQGRIGRALRAGDVLGLAILSKARAGFSLRPHPLPEQLRVRLVAGPQATPDAIQALCRNVFTVTSLDRMGVRLSGGDVSGGEVISEATPLGAVQVPPGGSPIVLLNDRGSIGGYAKPAVIHPSDLPLMAQLRPGQSLKFIAPQTFSSEHWFIKNVS
jgi:KipI family sensor histidine kinase inhibitor